MFLCQEFHTARVCTGTRILGVIGIGHSSCSIIFIHAVYFSLVLRIVILIQITVVHPCHFSDCLLKFPLQSLNYKLTTTDIRTKLIYPINPTPPANKQVKWSM